MLRTEVTVVCDSCGRDFNQNERLYELSFGWGDDPAQQACAECVADLIEIFSALRKDEEIVQVSYWDAAKDFIEENGA